MIFSFFLFCLSFLLLILSADSLVKGSVSFAQRLKIPTFVIGMTIVAFGTSAPEFVINLISASSGHHAIAVGNIIGACIADVLLVLGVCSLIHPLKNITKDSRKESLFAFFSVLLVFLLSNNFFSLSESQILTRADGAILLLCFGFFLWYTLHLKKTKHEDPGREYPLPHSFFFLFTGILGLYFGGDLLVENAVILARFLHASEGFIALSVISIGTTLPEFITSVVASLKKQNNIAIGNVLGSVIFNTLAILGFTSFLFEVPVASIHFSFAFSLGALAVLSFFLFTRSAVSRIGGGVFLAFYILYTVYLVMNA